MPPFPIRQFYLCGLFLMATLGAEAKSSLAERVEGIMAEAMARKEVPGGVVLVEHRGKTLLFEAYGNSDITTTPTVPTDPNGIYDLASLTKPLATAYAIMNLLEEGKLTLAQPIAEFIPEWKAASKDDRTTQAKARRAVTVEHLLRHQSGLPPFVRFFQQPGADQVPAAERVDWAISSIAKIPLRSQPGTEFVYSDLGFILLGRIVTNITGKPLEQYTQEQLYKPLGLKNTGYLPALSDRIVPTEVTTMTLGVGPGPLLLRGFVHDPNARWMGGVAGHAGLFSTADEVRILARQMLPAKGIPRVLSTFTARAMAKPATLPTRTPGATATRGLGWDMLSSYSGPKGDLLEGGMGHTGYTGTSVWIEPSEELIIVILTNRVHPDGSGDSTPLRIRVANAVAASLDDN